MTYEQFLKVQPQLIEVLANAMEKVLIEMGDDIKGIEWFSASAKDYKK